MVAERSPPSLRRNAGLNSQEPECPPMLSGARGWRIQRKFTLPKGLLDVMLPIKALRRTKHVRSGVGTRTTGPLYPKLNANAGSLRFAVSRTGDETRHFPLRMLFVHDTGLGGWAWPCVRVLHNYTRFRRQQHRNGVDVALRCSHARPAVQLRSHRKPSILDLRALRT